MSIVSIYCKENFIQFDEHGEEYYAMKSGRTYVGELENGVITINTEPNSKGESVLLSILSIPDDFVDIQ